MKKITLYTLVSLLSFSIYAQTPTHNWCGFDGYFKKELQQAKGSVAFEKHISTVINGAHANEKSGTTFIIPVVVHVMHKYGSENISKAQVEDGIRILNEDYSRTNPDTSSTRALFKPIAGNPDIEFRLARLDPNGNPTEGITRHYTETTDYADGVTKNIEFWPQNEYFNIWVVEEIGDLGFSGRILGIAVFPTAAFESNNPYGFIVVNDQFGTIGTASGSDSRTATHEIGHCLGLLHTFEDASGNNCNSGNCHSSGDMICDTPPSDVATYGCNTSQNTCSNDANGGSGSNINPYSSNVVDQIENYMSYDGCQNMFTSKQSDVMRNSLSTYTFLIELTSSTNLINTGTNDGYIALEGAPIADYTYNPGFGCEGNTSIDFTDLSYNDEDQSNWTWHWDFGDGDTSNLKSPTHLFADYGQYSVSLTASNTTGNSVHSKTDIIDVRATFGGQDEAFNEGFELNKTFPFDFVNPRMSWALEQSSTSTWEVVENTPNWWFAHTGNACLRLNCVSVPVGFDNSIVSPPIDFTLINDCNELSFSYAYAQRTGAEDDELKVQLSVDCGLNWSTVFSKSGSLLKTADPVSSGSYQPLPSEWVTETLSLSTFYTTKSNVRARFKLKSDRGNYVYLDDINVGCKPLATSIEMEPLQVNIYPNPSNEDSYIALGNLNQQAIEIEILDVMGKVISNNAFQPHAIDGPLSIKSLSGDLQKGVYLVNISTGNQKIVKQLIKY